MKTNELFDKCVANCDPATMKEVSDEVRGREPDKSLEEEVKNYFQGYWPGTETAEQCNTDLHFTPPAIMRLARHFAKWQKQQMLKDAEPAEIGYFNQRGLSILTEKAIERMPVSEGDKVKIIIVKEDEK